MPKWLVVVVVVVVALGLVGGGAAFAAYRATGLTASSWPAWNEPWQMGMHGRAGGFGGFMFRGPALSDRVGPLHEPMIAGLAEALGLSEEDFTARIEAGETPAEIAESQGTSQEDLATAFQEALAGAIQAAVDDGALTQEQADWILEHHGSAWAFGPGTTMMWGRGHRMFLWGGRGGWPEFRQEIPAP
jgi:hypothetical protein